MNIYVLMVAGAVVVLSTMLSVVFGIDAYQEGVWRAQCQHLRPGDARLGPYTKCGGLLRDWR